MAETEKIARLGDRLVQAGVITENQLKLALNEQRRVQEPLGRLLIDLGFITETRLAKTLAEQMGIAFISLKSLDFEPDLLQSIPPDFARRHLFVPIRKEADGSVVVAMANPANVISVDAIQEFLGTNVTIVASLESEISATISTMMEHDSEWAFEDLTEADPGGGFATADAALKFVSPAEGVDRIIDYALHNQATDIHIEPESKLLRIRYRIDGVLHTGETLPEEMTSPILTRIKIMSGLDITERRLPQDGRITMRYNQRKIDLRVSTMPTSHGENIVIRVLDRGSIALDLKELGMWSQTQHDLADIAESPYGMLLVSGPTGSGKTTTLYALLLTLDAMVKKVVTIEDPIEYELPLIRQSQVDPNIHYSFAEGLRTILRQDPDVILVGEIRDRETADVAMRAALTGHVVFSSIHTNTALGAIPRLMDIGIDPFLITASLAGVVAQRLVRRICPDCREPYTPTEEERRWLGGEGKDLTLYAAKGCPLCRHTGYRKRTALYELFRMDDDFARLIAGGSCEKELETRAKEKGMSFMIDDGRQKVINGLTTVREVLRVCRSL